MNILYSSKQSTRKTYKLNTLNGARAKKENIASAEKENKPARTCEEFPHEMKKKKVIASESLRTGRDSLDKKRENLEERS
jgi:hypothetical protein